MGARLSSRATKCKSTRRDSGPCAKWSAWSRTRRPTAWAACTCPQRSLNTTRPRARCRASRIYKPENRPARSTPPERPADRTTRCRACHGESCERRPSRSPSARRTGSPATESPPGTPGCSRSARPHQFFRGAATGLANSGQVPEVHSDQSGDTRRHCRALPVSRADAVTVTLSPSRATSV